MQHNPKISVVMASFLGEYEYAATDRVRKFHRAVNSFLIQTYENSELIIVSDGCDITAKEFSEHYHSNPRIKLIFYTKQPMFSGKIRNIGCEVATGDIICYLDSDDLFGKNHLQSIINGFNSNIDADWIYFDDQIIYSFHPSTREILSIGAREVKLHQGLIGTSSIAHKKIPEFNWSDCDGYGHDYLFVKKLIDSKRKGIKIYGCEYRVCHIPTQVDC